MSVLKIQEQKKWEDQLQFQIETLKVDFECQKRFCHRRWKYDFYIPPKLMIDVQGGIWTKGAHTRGGGYTRDCEKMAAALERGYVVLYVVPAHIKSGVALQSIEKIMELYKD